ncbi:MAG: mannitol dehydrogenase family protein [Actinomycetaceae bacterium]|nr:mannitol dehydrogenase family protein [Actinomycetaceae bacterium]
MSSEDIAALPRLSRTTQGHGRAPVRMIHLGLGNFYRAHQAWYTDKAPDGASWGYAAFTGRRPDMAEALAPQDGLYTLVTKGPGGNTYQVISSISAVHASSEYEALLGYFADPSVVIVTTTVTEAGYRRTALGALDAGAVDIAEDLAALKADPRAVVGCVPARVCAGLMARRARALQGDGKAPMTILPCDNLPGNGEALKRVVYDAAEVVDPSLASWMDDNIHWATSMVDRITPATTDVEREGVAEWGSFYDASPVPTEPFAEWVIAGSFPAGRPRWEDAGATICDDVEDFEQRKLWMLNGSHSLMAYAGPILGKETVEEAIKDPRIAGWVNDWWAVAGPHLNVPWQDYAAALKERFENPNIRHLLAQIAHDGSQKIPVRIFPVLRMELAAGRLPDGPVRAVAAWVLHLMGHGAPVVDAQGGAVIEAVAAARTVREAASSALFVVAADLADNHKLLDAIEAKAEEIWDIGT